MPGGTTDTGNYQMTNPTNDEKWYGFDLDNTTAYYDGWKGAAHIGEPVPKIVAMIKQFLSQGIKCKIFTARVAEDDELTVAQKVKIIQDWTEKHIGQRLEVTCVKDPRMERLYDDKAIRVVLKSAERLLDT
jgi:hypothetical protein